MLVGLQRETKGETPISGGGGSAKKAHSHINNSVETCLNGRQGNEPFRVKHLSVQKGCHATAPDFSNLFESARNARSRALGCAQKICGFLEAQLPFGDLNIEVPTWHIAPGTHFNKNGHAMTRHLGVIPKMDSFTLSLTL